MFGSNRSQPARERTAEERERARQERERRRAAQNPDITMPPGETPRVEEPLPVEASLPVEVPLPAEGPLPAEEPPRVDLPPTVETPRVKPPLAQEPPHEEPPEEPPHEEAPEEPSHEEAPEEPPHEEAPEEPSHEEAPEEPSHEEAPVEGSPHEEPPTKGSPHEEAPMEKPPVPSPLIVDPSPASTLPDSRMTRRVDRLREQRASSHRWHRRLPARLGALVALAAVGAAVWLLAQTLDGSTHKRAQVLPRVVRVTIPEGYTRLQIAALVKAKGLKGDYLADSKHSSLLHPERYGAPRGTANLEGFLFPATYDILAGALPGRLVDEQLMAFRENFGNAEIHRAHALGVTPYQLLTIASMIEREAEVQRDRPLIAAVIYSRLRQGTPLGIDATIRYALGDYSKPLTEAQLRTPSPYNTRLRRGLPPTPIGNPGMASIKAAAHPAHVSYLYYVAAADGCGEHVFSTSYAQFEHDAAAYREAVAKNHGQVPTCRKK